MCVEAMNAVTGEEISSIGEIRRLANGIVWNCEGGNDLPDENCLCQVDIPNTLVGAGFKVWLNPDALPEYLFEAVERPA